MASSCSYCQTILHTPNCPEVGTADERRLKLASYRFGWEHGRSGHAYDPNMMKKFFSVGHQGAWDLGEGNGIVALEEAENSEPPDYD